MDLHDIVVQMHDHEAWETLGRVAESQGGYVTLAQAEAVGIHRNTFRHHVRTGGWFERVERGLYRLRFFPSSPFEHIAAAWVRVGPETAVVSHESALELYGLSDVVPAEVHLTLPRAHRYRRTRFGARLHYPRTPLRADEVRRVHGVRATSPERTILDVLEGGTQPEQAEMAVRQALDRALTTPERLARAASDRPATIRTTLRRLVE